MKNPIEHNKNLKQNATRKHGEPFQPRKSISTRWGMGVPFAERVHDNMDAREADPIITPERRARAKKIGGVAAGVAFLAAASLGPQGGGETEGWSEDQKVAAERFRETGELPTQQDITVNIPPAEEK